MVALFTQVALKEEGEETNLIQWNASQGQVH